MPVAGSNYKIITVRKAAPTIKLDDRRWHVNVEREREFYLRIASIAYL